MLRHLRTSIQRFLFVFGVFGLVPWFFFRIVAGTWRVRGVPRYLEYAVVEPIAPWFKGEWWWYAQLEWYDWPVLPSLFLVVLAFIWPYGPARVVAWVSGSRD